MLNLAGKCTIGAIRQCPKCASLLCKTDAAVDLICPCGWVWSNDPEPAKPTEPVIAQISANIHGQASSQEN